ncbi:MAG: O-antigen ligase family protein [Bacteroidales bacterium]|jgi:tetratricopeptide (TPR) repeat protein|nr:O-antigen ligase family protein [Bacteroidales bacterium]
MYKQIADILFGLLIMIVLSAVFSNSRELGNGIVSGKYFWFYASMTLLSVVAIPAAIIKRKERLTFKLPDSLILLFCASAVLITLNHTGRLTNKCLLLIFVTMFYFYLRIFLWGKSKLICGLCSLAFVITGLAESIWGLMQLYGFTLSIHPLFKITGSFFNPGPYSGWLAMVFPMALGYVVLNFFNRKGREVSQSLFERISKMGVKILGILTVLCTLLVLPAAMSRASWLAALGGSVFIVVMYGLQNRMVVGYIKKYRRRLVLLSVVAVVLFAVTLTGLFLLKKDSASGRAFTWKIAFQTVKENPLSVGLGNFGGSYGDAQAAYFASGAGSEREEYVAGGVEYAFNEYLQICIETGIAPFLVFLAFVICVLVIGVRNKNYLPAGSLVSLLIFASMSYPFNVLPFVIAFVFLSALCMAGEGAKERKDEVAKVRMYPRFAVWAFLIIAPVMVFLLGMYKIHPLHDAYKQWNRTRILYGMNAYWDAAEEYAKQYPHLQDEIQFLFEYAQSLSKSEQYEKSNEVLRRAMQIRCDPMLYNIMGKNCQALKQYALAEQSFRKASNLVPNRLYPHYLLAKLYHEMGLKDKAEAETNIVMTKPPKVESRAVKEMREELGELRTKN